VKRRSSPPYGPMRLWKDFVFHSTHLLPVISETRYSSDAYLIPYLILRRVVLVTFKQPRRQLNCNFQLLSNLRVNYFKRLKLQLHKPSLSELAE